MVDSFTGRVWYCKIISSPRLLLRLNSVQDKAFQRSRTCPSCPMNTPFFTLEHALLLSCLYLFDIVLVASLPLAHVALFSWWLLRVFVLSIFISLRGSLGILFLTDFHRWTEAFLLTGRTHKRLQADDRYHRIYCCRWLKGSVSSVDLMSLCAFVYSVLLCSSVRERMQEACWDFSFSQIFTDEQKPTC